MEKGGIQMTRGNTMMLAEPGMDMLLGIADVWLNSIHLYWKFYGNNNIERIYKMNKEQEF